MTSSVTSKNRTVQRFSAEGMVTKEAIGHFVLAADYDSLTGRLTQAEAEIEQMHAERERHRAIVSQTRADNERLRGLLAQWQANCTGRQGSQKPCGLTSEQTVPSVVETKARCAKPDVHHPQCNCLERESRDAARYRFLRNPGNAIIYAKNRDAWGKNCSGHVRYDTAAELDAAIDSAMGPSAEETADQSSAPCTSGPTRRAPSSVGSEQSMQGADSSGKAGED